MADHDPTEIHLDPDTCTIEQVDAFDFNRYRFPFPGDARSLPPAATPRGILMQRYAVEHAAVTHARAAAERAREDAVRDEEHAREHSGAAAGLARGIRTLDKADRA